MASFLTTLYDTQVSINYDIEPTEDGQIVKVSVPQKDIAFEYFVSNKGQVTMPCCLKDEIIIAAEVMKAEDLG